MEDSRILFRHPKLISPISIIITLGVIYFVDQSLVILIILLPLWFFIFRPFSKADILMYIFASIFIVGQNYSVLKSGGFAFKHKDIFLMPYYEPFMWGFYYLNIKRFFAEPAGSVKLGAKAFLGLAITGVCFSFFSQEKNLLLISTLFSTGILFVMFHELHDLLYSVYALFLGFIIEIFGTLTGLWSYPDPDFLGIPYWFGTMWISVGLLGRRFLIPFTEWLAGKLP